MTESIKFPDEFQLQRPRQYYGSEDDPEAVLYCLARNALFDQALNSTLYVKFIDGDRKGSIARFVVDTQYKHRRAEIVHRWHNWSDQRPQYEIDGNWMAGTAKWDKRKNSCQLHLPSPEVVFLPNYQGLTIYQMFDRKAAKEKLLASPDQHDIDGKLLAVGDKVLYINTRYGSGSMLCHGVISEFRVSADSKGHSFTTIVKNDEGDEESAISYPWQMIWRK